MQEFGRGPNMRRPSLFFGTDFSLPTNNAPETYLSKGFYARIYLGNLKDFNDEQAPRDPSAKPSYPPLQDPRINKERKDQRNNASSSLIFPIVLSGSRSPALRSNFSYGRCSVVRIEFIPIPLEPCTSASQLSPT